MISTDNVVLVDMDGVLADYDAAVLNQLAPQVERRVRENFYIVEDYPRHAADIEFITSQPDFFLNLPLVDGAIAGWQRLLDAGYRPRVCTAPLTRNSHSVDGKVAWLRRHFVPRFGQTVVSDAIIDREKFRHNGIALIDDRPDVDTNDGQAAWRHIVFDQPYNKRSGAALRIHGWDDPHLEDVLATLRRPDNRGNAG